LSNLDGNASILEEYFPKLKESQIVELTLDNSTEDSMNE